MTRLRAIRKGAELAHISEIDTFDTPVQKSPGPQPPRRVLDIHADLQRHLQHMDPAMRERYIRYARHDIRGRPEWARSHLHPAGSMDDLNPWLNSLGTDLVAATTYQVTPEMIDLAEALTPSNPRLGDIVAEDLPSDWGFMWFDKPVDRPSVEDSDELPPLKMHAVSWAAGGYVPVWINGEGDHAEVRLRGEPHRPDGKGGYHANLPCVRIREWGWNDDPNVVPRPLHLFGQATTILSPGVHNPRTELHFVHMVWILMGMEITASTRHEPENRMARKRAAALDHHDVHVITLRRPKHTEREGDHRHVDWSCTWVVRGHWRYPSCDRCGQRHQACQASDCAGYLMPDGKDRTWIKPYLKGPEGAPLRAADLLYKLAR